MSTAISKILDEGNHLLDERAISRLHELAEVSDGWDGEDSKAMSLASLMALMTFLKKFSPDLDDLGIFMSSEGHIIANWHVSNERLIDICFTDNEVEVFMEDDFDESFSLEDEELYELMKNPPSFNAYADCPSRAMA
ncbi:hypothetical protein ACI2KR_09050 [Pseudomonas luteola]